MKTLWRSEEWISVASWFSLFTSCFVSGFLYEILSASRLEQMGLLGSYGFGLFAQALLHQ
jgi:hypothetical protein